MKLLDLEPRWMVLEDGGPSVGITFLCPHCPTSGQRLGVLFHHSGTAAKDDAYILAHHGTDNPQHVWDLSGQDDFSTLTLNPSVDASQSGHWHGFIKGGEAV